MRKLHFPSLHGLACAAFSSDKARDAYDRAIEVERTKSDSMYDDLISGRVDYFVQQNEPESNGRSLVNTWTRSSRKGIKIQMTVWLNDSRKKEFYALSHVSVRDKDDMYIDAAADDGDVYGISAENEEPEFITGFLQTLKG